MDSTTMDDGDGFEGLHPHARWSIRFGCMLGFAAALALPSFVAAMLLSTTLDVSRWTLVLTWVPAAFTVGAVAGWRFAAASFVRTRFRLDADGLSIRRGVVWRTETRVARSRVQHTDVNRGPLDRRLGLATLKVHTAGTRLASIEIAGLDATRALELRDALAVGIDAAD